MNEKEFTEDAPHLHPMIVDGGLLLQTYVDSTCRVFHEAAIAHCTEDESFDIVTLSQTFRLSLALDCIVDSYSLFGKPELLTGEAKPLITALKAELQSMLDRIEKIKYVAEESPPSTPKQGEGE